MILRYNDPGLCSLFLDNTVMPQMLWLETRIED